MSRLPPVPPASQSIYGPDGKPKTSVDISHRVRHQAGTAQRPAPDADLAQRDDKAPPSSTGSDLWMLAATGAVVAAIVWLAGKQRNEAPSQLPPPRRWQ